MDNLEDVLVLSKSGGQKPRLLFLINPACTREKLPSVFGCWYLHEPTSWFVFMHEPICTLCLTLESWLCTPCLSIAYLKGIGKGPSQWWLLDWNFLSPKAWFSPILPAFKKTVKISLFCLAFSWNMFFLSQFLILYYAYLCLFCWLSVLNPFLLYIARFVGGSWSRT